MLNKSIKLVNYSYRHIQNCITKGILLGGIIVVLSGCGEKVLICNKEFGQGQKLPLKYDEISPDFIKSLEFHTKSDRNDLEYVNKLLGFSPTSNIFHVSAYWSEAGLGSDGQKNYVKDTGIIQSPQTSIRWGQFENQSGLCDFMQ